MAGEVPYTEREASRLLRIGRDARRFSRKHRVAGTLCIPVTALGDYMIGTVNSWGWGAFGGGARGGVLLVTLVVAAMTILGWLSGRQEGPADAHDTQVAIFASGLYGVPLLSASEGVRFGRFIGSVATMTYVEPGGRGGDAKEPERTVYLESEYKELKEALDRRRSGVILVHGPPGSGKTTLVSCVLRHRDKKSVRQHDLASGEFDVKALLDDTRPGARTRAGLRPGDDVRGRLEKELGAWWRSSVIIVVDGAQRLFDPHDHTMTSPELAEALGVIASGRRRQVKVILIVQESPTVGPGSAWHETAVRIFVGGLRRWEGFETLLRELDPAFEFGLAGRPAAESRKLYNLLHGNPRLAELFVAALGLPESQVTANGLVRLLEQKRSEEREELLAGKVVRGMSEDQRRLVVALAAFGMQVTIEQVSKLLDSELSASRVGVLLPELVNWHVIARAPEDRYYLPAPAIQDALMRSKELSEDLLWEARKVLHRQRVPMENVREINDLDWQFAELGVLVRRAQLESTPETWEPVYGLMRDMEAYAKLSLKK